MEIYVSQLNIICTIICTIVYLYHSFPSGYHERFFHGLFFQPHISLTVHHNNRTAPSVPVHTSKAMTIRLSTRETYEERIFSNSFKTT